MRIGSVKVEFLSIVLLLLGICKFGCSPEISQEKSPSTLQAEFDPAAVPSPKIPTPTDLAYDASANRISIGVEEGDSDAQKYLASFLESLDGWPASMPAQSRFSGKIDTRSVTGGVYVFDITTGTPQPATGVRIFAENWDSGLRLHPGLLPSWEPGHRYAVAVKGGADGVKGAKGEEVVPSPAFWFFRASHPLVECEDFEKKEGCKSVTELLDDDEALKLEEIRSENADVFDSLERAGLNREDIALAWSFRTSSRPVVPFDPSINDVHFPNDYYMSEDETHVEIPLPEGSTPDAEDFLSQIETLDGFSLTGAPVMRFVGPVDGSSHNLTFASLLVLNADDKMDLPIVERSWDELRNEAVLIPRKALRPRMRYAVVATDYIADKEGRRIIPSHIWVLLRSPFPLVDNEGKSLIKGVSDGDANKLEEARIEYQELFETLKNTLGIDREKVQSAVVFTTRSILNGLINAREKIFSLLPEGNISSVTCDVNPETIFPSGLPRENVSSVIEGKVTTLNFLDSVSRRFDDRKEKQVEIDFLITLPVAPPQGRDSIPVVIFQHDLYGSVYDVFLVANFFAKEGFAVAGLELVGHGQRAVCLSHSDCTQGNCVEGMCTEGGVQTDSDGIPLNALKVFFPVDNPFSAGDAMRQQSADLMAFLRGIKGVDGIGGYCNVNLDVSSISFFGAGFGAMAGTMFMALEPSVKIGVLSGAGGNLSLIAQNSSETYEGVDRWLREKLRVEPESEAYHFFKYAWGWAADAGDPAVYARYLIDEPLEDPVTGERGEPKMILAQIPLADSVIPADAQDFFCLSLGTQVYPEKFEGGKHDFVLDLQDPTGISALNQAVVFISSGGETIIPAGN